MYRVLLIDDEKVIMQGLQKIIKGFNLGFDEFLIVEDGKEALEILSCFSPDLIITDIRMVYIDGLTLCEQIRKRGDALRDTPIILISGHGEFSYAKTAIQYNVFAYLLKPIDKRELYEVLHKARELLGAPGVKAKKINLFNEELFYDLLTYKDTGEPKLSEMMKRHGVDSSAYNCYQMIAAYTEAGRVVLSKALVEFSNHHLNMLGCIELDKMILVLLGISDKNNDHLGEMLKNLLLLLPSNENCKILLSDKCDGIENLVDLYIQIRTLNKSRRLFPDKALIFYDDIKYRVREGDVELKAARNIVSGIGSNDIGLVMGQFDCVSRYINENKRLSAEYIESIYKYLCFEVYRNYYNPQLSRVNQNVLDNLLNINALIEKTESIADVHAGIRSLILNFMELYNDFKKSGARNQTMFKASQYIEENFCDPNFSMQAVADRLNIASSYLSAQFKKNTGLSFNDYLTTLRMNKAIEYMKNKSLTILDISGKVGYVSEKHFYSVFKKHTGMTPAKYRNVINVTENR